MRNRWSVAFALLGCGTALIAPVEAGDNAASKPITFATWVKVMVDSAGIPTQVEADRRLPPELRTHVESVASGWRFEPVRVDGVAGSGATYVRLGACALPQVGGGYRFAIDYRTSGPGYATGEVLPPPYPIEAMSDGVEGTLKVTIAVGPNGRGTIEQTTYEGADPKDKRYFERTARDWVRAMRFLPEQFAGRPLTTRIRIPIVYSLTHHSRAEALAAHQKQASAKPECAAAAGGTGLSPVALDSPFKRAASLGAAAP